MEEFLECLYSEERSFYTEFLKKIDFAKKLKRLSEKCKNKRVLVYGNGLFCDVIWQNYDLKKYFNIIAVSDLRYENADADIKMYNDVKTYKPSEIKSVNPDVILIATINPKEINIYFRENRLVPFHTKTKPLVQYSLEDITKDIKIKFSVFKNYFKKTKDIFKSIKYFLFLDATEYQTKLNYHDVIENLKKEKNRKIRVLFLCEENPKWGYQSIYDEMLKDNNFEVLPIINLPIISRIRLEFWQKRNKEFFDSLNIPSIDGYDTEKFIHKSIEELKPDIIFYQQPWYIVHTQLPQVVSKYALTCIVSYGFTSINTQSWGSTFVRKVSGNMWKMFAESDYHNKFYQKAAKLKNKDILVTKGYPKLDYYRQPVNERFEKIWKDGNKSEKHRIIWAPHHSIGDYGIAMSNFKQHYKYFLDFAKKHKEYNFLVKPHPILKTKCIKENFMTAEQYDAYMDEWNSLENAVVYNEGNYFDIFKTSDVLITDSSSFLAEYFYSGKPIIFLDRSTRAGFNKFGFKIKKGFYEPKQLEDTEDLLYKLLIEKKDPLRQKREKIIKKEFYYPKDSSIGADITTYIKDKLGRN